MWNHSGFMFDRSIDSPWYADHTGWSWIMGLHGEFWLLIIALIVAMLILALRLGTRAERSSGTRRNSALDILKSRFARGEIDRADYLGRKQELS